MKLFRFFLLAIICASMAIPSQAKSKKNTEPEVLTIYVFGVAQNLADSTVYMTNISQVNGATMLPHELLQNHQYYTEQLKNYIAEQYRETHLSVAFYYARNQKNIEKKYARVEEKMKKHAMKSLSFKLIPNMDFKFKVPVLVQSDEY